MPNSFAPFSDGMSTVIDGLTLDSDPDRVSLYGNLDLSHDQAGLARARQLKTILDRIVAMLGSEADLPDHIEPTLKTVTVKNPFQ